MKRLRILMFNTCDAGGGAESVARTVGERLLEKGHDVLWAVGRKRTDLPWVADLQSDPRASLLGFGPTLARLMAAKQGRVKGAGAVLRALDAVAKPRNAALWKRGRDPSDFPELARVFRRFNPDIIHCHNLHGSGLDSRAHRGYFDLRCLAKWSASVPVCVTLHDAWLLTGHCGHPIECERYLTGCGDCPHLDNPPIYARDATDKNWQTKKRVLSESSLRVSAPSQWLLDFAARSILSPAASDFTLIPNGVDLDTFHPGDTAAARAELGIPKESRALLFLAGGMSNPYKSFAAAYEVFKAVQTRGPALLIVGGLRYGESLPEDDSLVPFRRGGPNLLHKLFAAADLYLHPATADNHPLAVLEAMACAKPVAAYAVGGIPEQINHGQTGLLAPPGDVQSLAASIYSLLEAPEDIARMGSAARREAENRFDVNAMADAYADWLTSR